MSTRAFFDCNYILEWSLNIMILIQVSGNVFYLFTYLDPVGADGVSSTYLRTYRFIPVGADGANLSRRPLTKNDPVGADRVFPPFERESIFCC
jgi:hypothetical protein